MLCIDSDHINRRTSVSYNSATGKTLIGDKSNLQQPSGVSAKPKATLGRSVQQKMARARNPALITKVAEI